MKTGFIISIFFVLCIYVPIVLSEEKKPNTPPPARVVVAEIKSGMIAPETEFVGTVYYQEVSDVASEVSGSVERVEFEEGQRMNKGDELVRLSADLLEKKLEAAAASYEQIQTNLENAEMDMKRLEGLRSEELVSEKTYDDQRFLVKSLEKRALSLKAEKELLQVELEKKVVRAPFQGIVIRKHVDRGEWVAAGASVATVAKDDIVDVIVEVPEEILKSVRPGLQVSVRAGGREMSGKVFAIVPRGDIATRTFPIKIRAINTHLLAEGMEARVRLPSGPRVKTFNISRDAVVTASGNTAVFAVVDSKARMIPVHIVGYSGMMVGLLGEGLSDSMNVVTKGNERLKDGQDVVVQ